MAYVVSDIDALLRINGDFSRLYTRMVTFRATFSDIISVGFPEHFVLEWLSNYKAKVNRYSHDAIRILELYPTVDMIIAMIRAKIFHGLGSAFSRNIITENVDVVLARANESPKLAALLLTVHEVLDLLPIAACYKLCHAAMLQPLSGHQDCVKYITPEYMAAAGHKNKHVTTADAWSKSNYLMAEHLQATTPVSAAKIVKYLPATGSIANMRRQLRMFPAARADIVTANILLFEAEHFEAFSVDAAQAKKLLRVSGIYGRPAVVRRLHAILRAAH